MIHRYVIAVAVFPLALLFALAATPAVELDEATLQRDFAETIIPLLKANCFDCHGTDLQEAKLDLSVYTSVQSVATAHRAWKLILQRVSVGEMPPPDAEHQPLPEDRKALVDWIQAVREFEARRHAGDPGPVLTRRLSNEEYNYTIRDLTGVDIQPTKTFPVDPANEAGFDNSGESLAMSPALLQKYLSAARQVVEHLVLKPDGIAFAPYPVVTNTDRDKYCVKRIVQFYKRQPSDIADYFLAAWDYQQRSDTALADVADEHGVSVKYLAIVWSLLDDKETACGPISKLRTMWYRLSHDPAQREAVRAECEAMRDLVVHVRQLIAPTYPNLNINDSHPGSQPFVLWKNRQYVAGRRQFNREVLYAGDGGTVDELLRMPDDEQQRIAHEASFARFCLVFPDSFYISERGRDYVDEANKQQGERGRLLSAGFHSMLGYFRDDAPLYHLILDESSQQEIDRLWQELDFVTSAPMRQYVGFLWYERTDSTFMREPQFDFARPENKAAFSPPLIEQLQKVYLEKAVRNGAGSVEREAIEHYFREMNEQIRWVKQARLEAEPVHVEALLAFAARAYRRVLLPAEQEELVTYYRLLREEHQLSHTEAIQDVLVSVLMSPMFCYRLDVAGAGNGQRELTDFELMSRLSYLLWCSTPDEELMKVAAAGELHQRQVLVAQLRRMVQDDRVRGFAVEFAGNWLDFRRFEEHKAVDRERFPQFTDELRQAMFEEPVRFFIDVVQQDRSVFDFLDADHTFVNVLLAKHYGLPADVSFGADGWVRLDNASQFNRGGVLPMSVFLTKNAPGLRTSPVKRGYWVVRRLLGERIPPPPPDVPELPADEAQLGDLTLAEALALHRAHASCAGCHDRFDAVGLAFEGFGPVGERRDRDLGGRPVSTTAMFLGGHKNSGISGLKNYLREQRQGEYLDNLCRKLLSYSLGRSLILSDELLIREMRQKLEKNDYRFGILIETIVTSPQFLNKRGSGYLIEQISDLSKP